MPATMKSAPRRAVADRDRQARRGDRRRRHRSDCVGTSNRQGALSVTQLEIMPVRPKRKTRH
jgi:hypothetical protein